MAFEYKYNLSQIPSADDYCRVFRQLDTPSRRNMLQVQYESPNRAIMASSMAYRLGYDHHGTVNLQYGKLAKAVAERLEIAESSVLDNDGQPYWYIILSAGQPLADGKFLWIMYPQVVEALEKLNWVDGSTTMPEELGDKRLRQKAYFEGTVKTVRVNRYERNRKAREACINHHGTCCSVCGFDFGAVYGERGRDFIFVHHLMPLYLIGKGYQLDPVEHLRPVCGNCHALMHLEDPPIPILEMKELLSDNGNWNCVLNKQVGCDTLQETQKPVD